MKMFEEAEMTIGEFFELSQQGGSFQIETPDGWKDVNFLVHHSNKKCFNVVLENGLELECSETHDLLTQNGWKNPTQLNVNTDSVSTKNGLIPLVAIESCGFNETFDVNIESEEHSYYSNEIVSHNCGKSLLAKATSNIMNLPMIKLDMGKIYQSLMGDSERNIRQSLQLAEACSPCCLWLDEIDKGATMGTGSTDSGVSARVIGTLLTWMQDRKEDVFIIATANHPERIDAALMRKGRFDEIFFVDLPNINERKEIWRIHITKRGRDAGKFDLNKLADITEGFVGAEIEQCVNDAMCIAFFDNREFTTNDLLDSAKRTKPQSVSMKGSIDSARQLLENISRKASTVVTTKNKSTTRTIS